MTDMGRMPRDGGFILGIKVPVKASLGRRRVPHSRILEWSPGAVIDLGRRIDQPLELMANNKLIGAATAVRIGNRIGARVTQIHGGTGEPV